MPYVLKIPLDLTPSSNAISCLSFLSLEASRKHGLCLFPLWRPLLKLLEAGSQVKQLLSRSLDPTVASRLSALYVTSSSIRSGAHPPFLSHPLPWASRLLLTWCSSFLKAQPCHGCPRCHCTPITSKFTPQLRTHPCTPDSQLPGPRSSTGWGGVKSIKRSASHPSRST